MMPTKMTLLQGSGNEREMRGAFPNACPRVLTSLEVVMLSMDSSNLECVLS